MNPNTEANASLTPVPTQPVPANDTLRGDVGLNRCEVKTLVAIRNLFPAQAHIPRTSFDRHGGCGLRKVSETLGALIELGFVEGQVEVGMPAVYYELPQLTLKCSDAFSKHGSDITLVTGILDARAHDPKYWIHGRPRPNDERCSSDLVDLCVSTNYSPSSPFARMVAAGPVKSESYPGGR